MKHSRIMLGVVFTIIATQGLGAHLAKPTKSPISVSANLNPQSELYKIKPTENGTDPDAASVLEKGSRVVASNTPDEDFVILGSMEPVLQDPPHIETDAEKQTQTNEMVAKTIADASPRVTQPIGPPPLLKAPVEVKAGIQPKVTSEAVMVAGPNIGATPEVTPDKVETSAKAVSVASVSPVKDVAALKPLPAVDLLLQRAEKTTTVAKAQAPVMAVKSPVHLAAKTPMHEVVKDALKEAAKAPVKTRVKVAAKVKAPITIKSPIKVAAKPTVKPLVKVAVASKVKHLIAKVNTPKVKPVHLALAPHQKLSKPKVVTAALHVKPQPVKSNQPKLTFASYQPPKHSKLMKPKVVAVKSVKASFKPVIKPFKPASLRVERKSHFHPVIKPYIAS
jgi:hypothetical protein